MTGAKFDIEKFDGTGDFGLWRIKMRALLIQHGCEAALEVLPADMEAEAKAELNKKAHSAVILCLGNKVLREVTGETTAAGVWTKLETLYMTKSLANKLYLKKKLYTFYMPAGRKISEHIEEFNKIVLNLANIEVKLEDEDLTLLLLTSLPASYEHFVDTLLYGREALTLEDVMATLNSKEIKERSKAMGDDGEGLYVRGRTDRRDSHQSRGKSRSKSRGGRLKCYICQSEDHLKRNCLKNNRKKSTSYVKKDDQPSSGNLTYDDSEVIMVMSIEALLDWIMDSGCSYHMTPRYIPEWKRNLISLGTFEKEGYTVKLQSVKVKLNASVEEKDSLAQGPSQVESLGGKRYFLSIVDDYSMRVWVYILRFKHEALGKFKEWKQLVENQTGRTVKKLGMDNGIEFCNREFEQLYVESGIARHLTVVGTFSASTLVSTGRRVSIVSTDIQEEPAPTGDQSGPSAHLVPKTAKQLAAKRNQERVKSILLLAIPDEYLLKFHNVPDAKSLWAGKQIKVTKAHMTLEVYAAPYQRRVYEDEMKRSSSSTSNSQNLAFLSSENTSRTNEVSTASGNFRVNTAGGTNSSSQVSSTPGADEVVCSFFAQQTTSPPLDNEDLQQIDQDDLEELDIRWQVAMLTVRVQRFIKKTGRNLDFKGKQLVTFDKSQVECYNCHRKRHFAKECKSGWNRGKRFYGDNGRRNATTNEPSSQALMAQDGLGGYDWSNDFDEPVNYALMAISSSSSSSSSDNEVQNCSKQCLESFKTLQKNYDSEREKHKRARLEIQGYELALESLESRILRHEKNELAWGEKYESSDEESTPVNDRFSKADGYHDVPPPITGNFLTPRADISFAGLDEYVIRKKIIESKTTKLNVDTSKSKTSETVGNTNEVNVEKPKSVNESVLSTPNINKDKVIIEDWNSDDEDDVFEVSPVKTNETQTAKT
ncbi:retrovirus-related pol polyprotein from transposon TNT 1-94 [Tanacetum coccineum]|uniref:Retrovirus-related pol polyprotein from transposon TNT 1-94 n=1 Tax=Tanacetum coccineum TaxID=301880 RepID=A0ABQ5HUL4_9ASTR